MTVTPYHRLLEACQVRGCPLCTIEQQAVRRYLDNLCYENVNSPALRRRLRHSRGFCREHAWLIVNERLGDALGVAIIYRDVLDSLLKDMAANPPRSRKGRWPLALPDATASQTETAPLTTHCPACVQRDEVTRSMLTVLVKSLTDAELQAALRQSDGLCLRHFAMALHQAAGNEEAWRALLDIQREKMNALQTQLAEFIRKNDYRYFSEGFGPEGDSWKRALALVVGNNPWNMEGKT